MSTSKKLYAARDFKDVGTGRSFAAGDEVTGKAGEIANYEAAGLLTDKKSEAAKADAPAA
ncbi:hypothetical protein LPN01_09690 [Sphingomonas sp. A2-49]|uniref:hypothetical protein n=1 Tax=Sphingomonas sp. A2-49 TaxID=1391375 RepID=UPI0021D25D1E|nr:hypothetical protein [Sphingomonas sp. A2-49]MCU6454351.1 hypothetical protein [Sphingomonas sp. A2-49]